MALSKERKWVLSGSALFASAMTAVGLVPVFEGHMFWLGTGCVLLVTAAAAAAPVRIGVADHEITVVPGVFRRHTFAKQDIAQARVIDWTRGGPGGEEERAFRPKKRLRAWTHSDSDYRLGWYRLENGHRALVATRTTRVLCLEVPGMFLLLAPERFEQFVAEVDRRLVDVIAEDKGRPVSTEESS